MQVARSGSAEDSKDKGDEVQQWIGKAEGFRKWDLKAFEREFVKGKDGHLDGNGKVGGKVGSGTMSKKRAYTPEEGEGGG